MFDVVTLSRIQFAATIMFHYLFPPLTIGMGVILVYLEGGYLWTREAIYETAAKFWTQLYAVTFAMGVATGIVMEFEFGTNWAVYSRFVGDVFGSALAAEGIFAFFLESGFLAVLVFGWDKVSPKFHFYATVMVAFGSMFSAVWIIIANSWQQTPAGHQIVQMTRDGKPWFDAAGQAHHACPGRRLLGGGVQSFLGRPIDPHADRRVHPGSIFRPERFRLLPVKKTTRGICPQIILGRACSLRPCSASPSFGPATPTQRWSPAISRRNSPPLRDTSRPDRAI
jgi:hypothetical protein